MKRDFLQNDRFGSWRKWIFADIICFAIILIVAFGFCSAYFSNKLQISGNATLGHLDVMYCQNSTGTTSSQYVYGSINGGSSVALNTVNTMIAPGDTLKIQGYAVNTSNVDVFVLGRLEINFTNPNSVSEQDVVWYNIATGTPLYVERGLFQVGASVLYESGVSGDKQQINASYTFSGDKFINGYTIDSVVFELVGHQAEFINFANEFDMDVSYNSYITVSGGKNVYNENSKKLACHLITGRRRDVWKDSDANANGVISDLETDDTGAYLINSCADWMLLCKLSNTQANTQNKIFKLNCYLDFDNNTTQKVFGSFYGDFDGQGYTISNINLTREYCLFRDVRNSNITNLGVDSIKGTFSTSSTSCAFGGIAQFLYQGKIENCFVIGASAYDSSIEYDINITATNSSADCRIGGIVGNIRGDNSSSEATAIVSNCYAKINLKCNVGTVGGITGSTYPRVSKNEFCYFEGKVSGAEAGAIVGTNQTFGTIENCVANVKGITFTYTGNNVINGHTSSSTSDTGTINCAYIRNNAVTKVGLNQTVETVVQTDFYSIGKLRDLFGWDTSVWSDDIYHTSKGMPVLKAFYNF